MPKSRSIQNAHPNNFIERSRVIGTSYNIPTYGRLMQRYLPLLRSIRAGFHSYAALHARTVANDKGGADQVNLDGDNLQECWEILTVAKEINGVGENCPTERDVLRVPLLHTHPSAWPGPCTGRLAVALFLGEVCYPKLATPYTSKLRPCGFFAEPQLSRIYSLYSVYWRCISPPGPFAWCPLKGQVLSARTPTEFDVFDYQGEQSGQNTWAGLRAVTERIARDYFNDSIWMHHACNLCRRTVPVDGGELPVQACCIDGETSTRHFKV